MKNIYSCAFVYTVFPTEPVFPPAAAEGEISGYIQDRVMGLGLDLPISIQINDNWNEIFIINTTPLRNLRQRQRYIFLKWYRSFSLRGTRFFANILSVPPTFYQEKNYFLAQSP